MPSWAHFAYALYVAIAAAYTLGNLFAWWMGPCPAFGSATNCDRSMTWEFWLFPGSQFAAIILGWVMLRIFHSFEDATKDLEASCVDEEAHE